MRNRIALVMLVIIIVSCFLGWKFQPLNIGDGQEQLAELVALRQKLPSSVGDDGGARRFARKALAIVPSTDPKCNEELCMEIAAFLHSREALALTSSERDELARHFYLVLFQGDGELADWAMVNPDAKYVTVRNREFAAWRTIVWDLFCQNMLDGNSLQRAFQEKLAPFKEDTGREARDRYARLTQDQRWRIYKVQSNGPFWYELVQKIRSATTAELRS